MKDMAVLGINFEWSRGRARESEAAYEAVGDQIRQVVARAERFSPLEKHEHLYLEFANLKTAGAYCAFAQSCGLLLTPARESATESVKMWEREIKNINEWMRRDLKHFRVAGRLRAKLTSIDVFVEYGLPGSKPTLLMRPADLLSALKLQYAQDIASGASIGACERCGKWFARGGRGDENKRRSISKFCSEACKNRAHYERTRKAAR
jgi:hypothetical protein